VPAAIRGWWFAPMPMGRVAGLRAILYLFVWVDVFAYDPWVASHGDLPASTYQPLVVDRVLHLPAPGHTLVLAVEVALLVCATAAATGKLPRLLGWATFALYFEWMLIADSFGKVDHDRFAFLVALAVLPTVGAARFGERRETPASGWALRCVQVAVIATYALAPWAKFRFGGFDWADSGVLVWALLRRGTVIGSPLLHAPVLLHVTQWCLIAFELASPIVLFLRGRALYLGVGVLLCFHLVSYATISISFLPHLLCLAAFLPLERIRLRRRPPSDPAAKISMAGGGVAAAGAVGPAGRRTRRCQPSRS
jgi:hypothetical protein